MTLACDEDGVRRLVEKALSRLPGMRPLPVLVNGENIKLHLLLAIAKSMGGYTRISRDQAWGDIAAQLGYTPIIGPSIKLVYVKYLKALESGNILKEPPVRVDGNQGRDEQGGRQGEGEAYLERPVDAEFTERARDAVTWVRRVALRPGDALGGQGPPGSSQDQRWADDCCELVRRFRSKDGPNERRKRRLLREPATPSKRIGDAYQAAVPTAVTAEDNHAVLPYLGTMVWGEPENAAAEAAGRAHRVGKGYSSGLHKMCNCANKMSVECVRRHIAEEKQQLVLELGVDVYRKWGFDRMGEVVAYSWSKEQQRVFEAAFDRGRPWTTLKASFPDKSRAELVSFYFSSFVLRRRAVQNRTGREPDSDDDDDVV